MYLGAKIAKTDISIDRAETKTKFILYFTHLTMDMSNDTSEFSARKRMKED